MEEVPAGRGTQQGAGGVACGVRFERTVGVRAQGGAQRALPLRLGPEIQELLRCALTGGSATTERMRRGAAGRRGRREFVVVGVWNRAMCHRGMAERHSITAGSDEMNKTEMTDRLAARTGLSKSDARDAVDGVFAIVGETHADGEEVRLPGFGTFGTRSRPARTGRNPRTGEAVVQGGEDAEGYREWGSGIVTVRREKTATGSAANRLHMESGRFLYDDGHATSYHAAIRKTQGARRVGGCAAAGARAASRMR